eukprot:491307_1
MSNKEEQDEHIAIDVINKSKEHHSYYDISIEKLRTEYVLFTIDNEEYNIGSYVGHNEYNVFIMDSNNENKQDQQYYLCVEWENIYLIKHYNSGYRNLLMQKKTYPNGNRLNLARSIDNQFEKVSIIKQQSPGEWLVKYLHVEGRHTLYDKFEFHGIKFPSVIHALPFTKCHIYKKLFIGGNIDPADWSSHFSFYGEPDELNNFILEYELNNASNTNNINDPVDSDSDNGFIDLSHLANVPEVPGAVLQPNTNDSKSNDNKSNDNKSNNIKNKILPTVFIVTQPEPITIGWPDCCSEEYNKNPEDDSGKKSTARKWIDTSIIKWYRPCSKCSYDITRRVKDKYRKSIWDRIQWGLLEITNVALEDLTLFDLVHLGATAGALDFMNFILSTGVDGNKLVKLLNDEMKLAVSMDILAVEWNRIDALLNDVNVNMSGIRLNSSNILNNLQIGTDYCRRIGAAGGVFGKYGKKYGAWGRDADGNQAWCAEQGKLLGGRKPGVRNTFNLTNKGRLEMVAQFEDIPVDLWSWIIKQRFISICYDKRKEQWNYAAIDRIKNDILNWSEDNKCEALKLAYIHKRGNLKSFNTGAEPRLTRQIEFGIDNILECRFDKLEELTKHDAASTAKGMLNELDDWKVDDDDGNKVYRKDSNGVWKYVGVSIACVDRGIFR